MALQQSDSIELFTYTPSGRSAIDFNRVGADPPWFSEGLAYTKDLPLGGSQPYIEVGAESSDPLRVLAWLDDAADLATMRSYKGTRGTLTTAGGRSASVVLVGAVEVQAAYTAYQLTLTFERIG